jgi:hypothetical protein
LEYLAQNYPDFSCVDLPGVVAEGVEYKHVTVLDSTADCVHASVAVVFKEIPSSGYYNLAQPRNVAAQLLITLQRDSPEIEFDLTDLEDLDRH